MTARCALCKDEREYQDVTARTACASCGARKTLRVLRVQSTYVPTGEINRPALPALARKLEESLA